MAIVLVPGFMLDDDLWTDIEAALEPFGPLIHADPAQGASIGGMAQAALDAAPEEFALIGFSMGGYVAREMVRLAPGRVEKLVLIATSSRGDGDLQAQRKQAAAAARSFAGAGRKSIRQSLAPAREEDTGLVERIHAMSVRLGGEVFARQAAFHRETDTGSLDQIQCPVLVIAGDEDRLRSLEEARELQAGIPGAQLAILPSGHMIPLEDPAGLASLLVDFLKG